MVAKKIERHCVSSNSVKMFEGEVVFIGIFGVSETNYEESAWHEGYSIVERCGAEEVSDGGGTVVEDDSITTYITH